MDTHKYTNEKNTFHWDSIASTVREILRESRKRHIVIRKISGEKVFECSVLLVLILSISAPVLPAIVNLGMLVKSIKVSW